MAADFSELCYNGKLCRHYLVINHSAPSSSHPIFKTSFFMEIDWKLKSFHNILSGSSCLDKRIGVSIDSEGQLIFLDFGKGI